MLALARIAQPRSASGLFSPGDIEALFDDIGLPRPSNMSNVLAALQKREFLTRPRGAHGATWKLTPQGRARSQALASDIDLAALRVDLATPAIAQLGDTAHPAIPPSLAPPSLLVPLRTFLNEFPFEHNVFGMTRFPGKRTASTKDPLAPALEAARSVCQSHGLVFHLASDRSIVDDLWPNVAAHMWGCAYGLAFFEARGPKGLNYNLNIEVGSCLALGRRLALLKDHSLAAMPSDLVGHIYREVDLDEPKTVEDEIAAWLTKDLKIGAT